MVVKKKINHKLSVDDLKYSMDIEAEKHIFCSSN